MDLLPVRDESHAAMGHATFNGDGYTMQPRVNLRRNTSLEPPVAADAPHDALKRRCTGDTCEKASSANVTNIAIILGIGIPIVVGLIVLLILHRRNVRRLRMEDAKDHNVGLDFGIEEAPRKGSKRKSLMKREKTAHKPGQLSMDMNLSSPYLLPPDTHQSHDSIHSLARTFRNDQDPYRPVKEYTFSETGSIRSCNPFKEPSSHSGSKRTSIITSKSLISPVYPPSRMNSMPKSPVSPDDSTNPFASTAALEPIHQLPAFPGVQGPVHPVQPAVPEVTAVPYPDNTRVGGFEMPLRQPSPAAVSMDFELGLPDSPAEHARLGQPPGAHEAYIGVAHTGDDGSRFPEADGYGGPAALGFDLDLPDNPLPTHHHAVSAEPHAFGMEPGMAHSYDDGNQGAHPEIRTSEYYDEYDEGHVGQSMQPQAPVDYNYQQPQGLGVPQQGSKRLSVGFRPLPPDEITESEDPEYRANRIRSFYKEYFEESKEPPPPLPTQRSGPLYHEDYDENYLGDAAYYDVDTNAFVMPYAQPVTRRAMTPPPAGRFRGAPRGPGGRGPRGPHGPQGSIGGMSLPGGARRQRAGSSYSPRPGSSASTMRSGGPSKHLPPPSDLKTLPTPSMLRDDSFALLNAVDFAPPDSFGQRAAGRSQSPLGERRPYQPRVPAASPLVTAFDELAVLPSPHMLRKSNTFTNLDFLPPKKFQESDSMSDAGSIRSNKSGISALQLGAIRNGAGRVSRLPGDMVFTAAALPDQLRPKWDMRA